MIVGAIVGGILAAIYELIFGFTPAFNGREGYEGTGQIGFILGALTGFVASGIGLFGKRTKK